MATKKRWLDREIVVQTAAEMANEAGDMRELTLTALAGQLNVRTPSLYNHVKGIEDLHYALALYTLEQILRALRRATAQLTGREALMAAAEAYRRFAQQNPGIYALVARAPEAHETELVDLAQQLLQHLLLILSSLGLDGEDALHAVRGLRAILHGFVSLEAAQGFRMELDRELSFRRLLESYLNGIKAGG